MLKRLFLTLALAGGVLGGPGGIIEGLAEDFLVRQDGSQLTQEVHNTDPKTMTVLYWEMHLYKNGGTTGWGMLMNKTYDGLMRELKNGQNFDKIWAKATKTDVESFDNYQHPGPAIAVVESPVRRGTIDNSSKLAISVLDEVQDLIERYNSSAQTWDLLKGKWDDLKVKERGALENAGRVFTEYTRNFKDAFQKLTSLQSYLTRLDYSSMNELTNALDQFKESLDTMDGTGNQAQKALDSAVEPKQSDWTYDTGSGAAAKMLRSFVDVPTSDGLYEHRKFLKNGNNFPVELDFATDTRTGKSYSFSPTHLEPGEVATVTWTDDQPQATYTFHFKPPDNTAIVWNNWVSGKLDDEMAYKEQVGIQRANGHWKHWLRFNQFASHMVPIYYTNICFNGKLVVNRLVTTPDEPDNNVKGNFVATAYYINDSEGPERWTWTSIDRGDPSTSEQIASNRIASPQSVPPAPTPAVTTQENSTPIQQRETQSEESISQQIAAAENQLNATYSSVRRKLSPQQKERLKQDELAWIAHKDTLPAQEKLSAVQNRIQSLEQQYGNSGVQSARPQASTDQNLILQIDAAEKQLKETYSSIRSRLDAQQKNKLKMDELKWIAWKDSLPLAQKLAAIKDRIQTLQQGYGR